MPACPVNHLRRWLRAWRYASRYPILLPHYRLDGRQLLGVNLPSPVELSDALAKALALCDGTRPLAQIAADARISRREILRQHESGRLILWPSPLPPADVSHTPTNIIISPHPDDAAISLGGAMLASENWLILDVFSKVVWWRFNSPGADAAEIQSIRDREESLAASLLRARVHNLDLPEAILRSYLYDDLFTAPIHPRDADITRQIIAGITAVAQQSPRATWHIPLAVGGHVDHRLCRDAAMIALMQSGIPLSSLRFYEELPYAADAADNARAQLPNLPLTPAPIDIRPQLARKIELLRAYASQLAWSQIQTIAAHARRHAGVERLWKPAT